MTDDTAETLIEIAFFVVTVLVILALFGVSV